MKKLIFREVRFLFTGIALFRTELFGVWIVWFVVFLFFFIGVFISGDIGFVFFLKVLVFYFKG